jgi:hypothetical protein
MSRRDLLDPAAEEGSYIYLIAVTGFYGYGKT